MPENTHDSQSQEAKKVESAQAEVQAEEAEAFQNYPSVPDDDDPGPPTGGG